MPPHDIKPHTPRRFGPPPAQGALPLGQSGEAANRLEQRLVKEPELLRRIAEAAVALARGSASK